MRNDSTLQDLQNKVVSTLLSSETTPSPLQEPLMADETPAWLAGAGAGDSPAASSPMSSAPPRGNADADINAGQSMLNSSGASAKSPKVRAPVDESDLPRMILLMRVANMLSVGSLIAISIIEMISLPPPSVWVLSMYATIGGLLVCCLETQLKFLRLPIAMNFGFLFSPFWRFGFYLLMASIAWSYERLYSYMVSTSLILTAFFNTYILCRYPSYNKTRELIAEEEDRRIQAKISGEVKKAAISHLAGP